MVRRSVPYHAFMPRRSASASPPCSCSRAGAFLWGGLACTRRMGGLRMATPCSPRALGSSPLQHPHHLSSSVPAARAHCGHGGSTPGQHREIFPGAISGLLWRRGEHTGVAASLVSCACGRGWWDPPQPLQSGSQMRQGQGECIRAGISLPQGESPSSSLLRVDGAAGRIAYSGGSQSTSRCSQKDGVRWHLPRGSIPVELTQPWSVRALQSDTHQGLGGAPWPCCQAPVLFCLESGSGERKSPETAGQRQLLVLPKLGQSHF